MISFDSVLEVALDAIRAQLGDRPVCVTFVRTVAGQVTAVLPDEAFQQGEWSVLAAALDEKLRPYSPGPRTVLLRRSDLIDEKDVIESLDAVRLPVDGDVWLVDRVLTNRDWLRKPLLARPPVPTVVGFSLKGGVGRTTALAVLAWHLARMGKKVLAVDLDLEAPGLGSLLLDDLPRRGVVDWLVEALTGRLDADLLEDCVAMSALAGDTPGIIQVLPALGQATRDYVAKIGRVYFPPLSRDGTELGLSERLIGLLHLIATRQERPDVVLLDARAGLHDIGAAAVSRLGAEVLLFARDEPQSWHTYRVLFDHLARSRGVEFGMPEEDLRWRLTMVAAQLDKTEQALDRWVEASYESWSALYDDESRASEQGPPAQTFVRDDPDAPHYPLPVYFDGGLRSLSLSRAGNRPAWPAVEAAFGPFLKGVVGRLLPGLAGKPGPSGGSQ